MQRQTHTLTSRPPSPLLPHRLHAVPYTPPTGPIILTTAIFEDCATGRGPMPKPREDPVEGVRPASRNPTDGSGWHQDFLGIRLLNSPTARRAAASIS